MCVHVWGCVGHVLSVLHTRACVALPRSRAQRPGLTRLPQTPAGSRTPPAGAVERHPAPPAGLGPVSLRVRVVAPLPGRGVCRACLRALGRVSGGRLSLAWMPLSEHEFIYNPERAVPQQPSGEPGTAADLAQGSGCPGLGPQLSAGASGHTLGMGWALQRP